MPLESTDPKGRHWEREALPVIGTLVPGVYNNPQISVDEFGRVVSASSGGGGSIGIGAQDSGVAVPNGPFSVINFNGSNLSALDAGSGVLEVIVSGSGSINALDEGVLIPNGPFSTFNFIGSGIVASDAGGGQLNINVVATSSFNVQYVKGVVSTGAVQNIGAPVPSTALIRTVSVVIDTPYDPGTTLEIQDGTGIVLMNSGLINPQVAGTYILETPGNTTAISNTQIVMIVSGSPTVGTGVVDVFYENP